MVRPGGTAQVGEKSASVLIGRFNRQNFQARDSLPIELPVNQPGFRTVVCGRSDSVATFNIDKNPDI